MRKNRNQIKMTKRIDFRIKKNQDQQGVIGEKKDNRKKK